MEEEEGMRVLGPQSWYPEGLGTHPRMSRREGRRKRIGRGERRERKGSGEERAKKRKEKGEVVEREGGGGGEGGEGEGEGEEKVGLQKDESEGGSGWVLE